ncbi:hypothetical protein FOMG_19954 [Fusarium oxysporum f. sp. melonis 26406]|uniref:Uncharacterized protein n=1 Tax=Fusarium oxysporum f. sp. melonis 26406 TaxID=1089452 RepID=W9Z3Q8_FUSOX|nr:hypothetical protein FOMG_19954 [Fusarium oxysporum f. sp. melonis 26406]
MGSRMEYPSARTKLCRGILKRMSFRSSAWFAKPIGMLLNRPLAMPMQRSFGQCMVENEIPIKGLKQSEI